MMINKNLKVRKGFILKIFLVALSIFILLKLLFVYFEYIDKDKPAKKFFLDETISMLSCYVRELGEEPVIYLQARTPLLNKVDKMEVVLTTNQWEKKEKIDFKEVALDGDYQIWRVNLGKVNGNKKIEFYVNCYQRNRGVFFWNNRGLNYQMNFEENNGKLNFIENFPKNEFYFDYDNGFKFNLFSKMTERFEINRMKEELEKIPFRKNMETLKEIEDFKKNHLVVVSLTTSPKRISKVKHVIDTLDLTFVDEVVIAVPTVYARTKSEYLIPEGLEGYKEKTKILRVEKDLGPITKLLPAVEYVRSKPNGENGIVITIDDDIGYSKGLIREFILGIMHKEKSVIGASAQNLSFWGIQDFGFPEANKNKPPEIYNENNDKVRYVERDIVEGFAGIAYPVEYLDTELMKFLSQRKGFKECFLSDDLVISFVLAYSDVARYWVKNEYIAFKPFPYGVNGNEDALHHGAGFLSTSTSSDINELKYSICYKKLIGATMDFEALRLKDRERILNP